MVGEPKARIACSQRLRQRLIGQIFCSEEGQYPEGEIELRYQELEANDTVYQNLCQEEKKREKELVGAVEELEIYRELFKPIEGCGPMIAARIIAAIGDIRLFASNAKLKAACGVHVLPDGRFPRHRSGEQANWNGLARQALYLLGEQFNRRPDSVWGQKLREYKKKFREKHPVVEVVNGKKRYTNGHIHNMAIWRTLTKFVERLWKDWWKIEKARQTKALNKERPVTAAPTEQRAAL